MPHLDEPAPESKWVHGVSENDPLHKAAHRILQSRLSAVSYWLPLAALKSDEDVEYVHQLRVSTRRAVEALRVFSDLIPEPACQDLHGILRVLRLAADDARNLDVLCARFVRSTDATCDDTCRQIAEAIRHRRQEAQRPIGSLYEELVAGKFNERIAGLLEEIEIAGKGKSKPIFGKRASRYLNPLVKKFFRASQADLTDDEALHDLRLRIKRLRYRMEIVAPAFGSTFRKKLYGRISTLQECLGMVNDHAMAKTFFSDWIEKTEDAQQKAFFRGLLFAEAKAHEDLRQALFVILTPKAIKELRRQFRACCGSS